MLFLLYKYLAKKNSGLVVVKKESLLDMEKKDRSTKIFEGILLEPHHHLAS